MPPATFGDYDRYVKLRDEKQPRKDAIAPAVSIVTVVLNSAATLERTITSVQSQTFKSIEQVFVDGVSTDESIDVIRRLALSHDFWISEKDKGISDAFNKGVAMTRGKNILILNADDWLSPDQIEKSVEALDEASSDFAFGDLIFYERGLPIFRYVGDPHYAKKIHRRWPAVGHPTLLAKRECFARAGLFDTEYRNAMDYEWLLRLHRYGARGTYSSKIVGHMTHDGVSNRQFQRTIREVQSITVRHGRNPLLAKLEADLRYGKTKLSVPIKRFARPAYEIARRSINPAYKTISNTGAVK